MIQYIYFVKCPECEDELFDFFDEAKDYAMGCLTKKPTITQTEVCRNDFGECTDHCDLGTVWSWEEAMKDVEGGYTDAEPTKSIFTSDDLKLMADGKDPEFDNIDNSLDVEVAEPETSEVSVIDEIPDNFRKPIPDGMTIEDLVEEMEENEDTVECTWCNDLFDKSECRKEVNLGWLCSRCEAAIKSRGETLTFKENNYWDFLDEDIEKPIGEDLEWHTYKITFTTKANPENEQTTTFKTWQSDVEYAWRMSNANIPHTVVKNIELVESVNQEMSLADLVKDSISHLVNDLGKDSSAEDFTDLVIRDLENNYDAYVPDEMEKYGNWASAVACEVSRQLNNLTEDIDPDRNVSIVILVNEALSYLIREQGKSPAVDGFIDEVIAYIAEQQPTYIPKDRAGYQEWWNMVAKEISLQLNKFKLFEDIDELHDLGNEYDGGYPAETPEVSDPYLKICPECGKETFDIETGICVGCGFN